MRMHTPGLAMAAATHSASGASGSSAHGVSDALFSEPHEYREEQRMLVKLLGQMQSGLLPAQLLPLLRSFLTEGCSH